MSYHKFSHMLPTVVHWISKSSIFRNITSVVWLRIWYRKQFFS
jgi:hypothetical protein